jgi:hypothetical protein
MSWSGAAGRARPAVKTLIAAVTTFAVWASPAVASTGDISRAVATADWTRASIAGSVTWDGCSAGSYCAWIPVATVVPALPSYTCSGEEALDSDPDTRGVWSGGNFSANGTVSFDIPDAVILPGVHGQRLCLSVIQTVKRQEPLCLAQAPILGYDPATCPLVNHIGTMRVTSRLLTAEVPSPPPAPQPAPPPPPVTVVPQTAAPTPLTAAFSRRAADAALARRLGRRWSRARLKRLRCAALNATTFECRVSFEYKRVRYAGRVLVSGTQETATARVSVRRRRR